MKIWTVATDTKFGTESHIFHTEEEFNRFMHDFLMERWDEHSQGPMPDDWNDAWEAMGETLGDLDTFQCGEEELYEHPVVIEALGALALAHERLEMNNYGGEEDQHIAQLAELIEKLAKPKPEKEAA